MLAAQFKRMRDLADDYRIKVQLVCDHPLVLEAPYQPLDYGDSIPSFRVCARCGFAEEGWNCGHQILTRVDKEVDRKTALDHQCGPQHANHRFVRDGEIRDKRKLYERAVRGISCED